MMTARRGQAPFWLTCAVCGVAFAMWHWRRRQRALETTARATRLACPPPAPLDDAPTWTLPPHVPSFTPPHAPWLQRASMAIHLVQPSELAGIARELAAAGYPAAAGVLDNYALLLERTNVSRSRILVEVTRLLSTALADPPTANGARTRALGPRPRSAGTASPIPMPRPREAPSSSAPRSALALAERRRAGR